VAWTGLSLLLLLGLVCWVALSTWFTAWKLTHPPRRTYASAVARGKPGTPDELTPPRRYSGWQLPTARGSLGVWEIDGDDPDGAIVIFTHGWGDSRIGALARIEALAPGAAKVIAWDLPGHGVSPGICRLGADEHELLLLLTERVRTEGRSVVLVGASLGAGVSIVAAAAMHPEQPAAVVAEAPYRVPKTPAANVLGNEGLPVWPNLALALAALRGMFGARLGGEAFDRAAHAAKLRCPLLVLHGTEDDVCPAEDGRAIAAAASEGRWEVVEGGGHNDLWRPEGTGGACAAIVRAFLASCLAAPVDNPGPADR
jgi:pimeloyl-ACP methyl ester carboxylesterase